MNLDHHLRLKEPETRTLFGVRGAHSIGYGDLLFLEHVLSSIPWRRIVELGTGSGLTTLYLGVAAELRGAEMFTFDIKRPGQQFMLAWPSCVRFAEADLMNGPPRVQNALGLYETLAIFDNGNKPNEVKYYVPYLGDKGAFLVHDWGSEITMDDVEPVAHDHNFEPFAHDVAEMLCSKYRAWRKIE